MKKHIVVLGLVLVCSLTLAQRQGTPEAGGQTQHMKRFENKLGLTDEQARQMREIRDSGGSMAEMRAVLTPEQQAKAARMKSKKGARDQYKARVQGYLGLSEQQTAEMAQIRKEGGSREEMRAVLTPEQQSKFDTMHSERD